MFMSYSQAHSQTPCILAVDDVVDNLFLLQVLLESEGYRVETADSGHAALAKAKAEPPDLVLLDVMMPDMDGCEVTRHLRQNQQFSNVPILLLTAHDEVNVSAGLEAGANDLIRKPIDFDQLLNRISAIFGQGNDGSDCSLA